MYVYIYKAPNFDSKHKTLHFEIINATRLANKK